MLPWPFRRDPASREPDLRDREIREELEFYLELRTRELMEEGLDPDEARREAEARFGDQRRIEREVRRQAGGRDDGRGVMREIWQDVRFALRTFGRNPGFTAVAVLTLGLAVAGNTAVFSVLDEALLQALPFPDHQRLVFVNGVHRTEDGTAVRLASVPEFRDWQERARTLDPLVAVNGVSLTLADGDMAERIPAEIVGEGYFRLLGGEAHLGRTFTPEEYETLDGYPLLVISRGLWERRFGADPDVVGRSLLVNDREFRILGVMGPDFRGINPAVDAWIPLGMVSVIASATILESRGSRFLPVIGKLAPGATMDQAQEEMDAIAVALQERFPEAHRDRFAQLQGFRDRYLGTTGRLLWILFAAGSLLLAIAAANVANLLLVRSHARVREFTVRRAMGAGGGRVARQLLTESLVLAGLGGLLGLGLAGWGIGALLPLLPAGVLPPWVEPGMSFRVFGFTLLILAVVGLLAGLMPALSSARHDLAGVLRGGGRGSVGDGGHVARSAFVVTQVALAILLLVGAGLLTRSFQAQLEVDPGLHMEGVQVFRISPPQVRYPDADALRLFTGELVRRLGEVPGVRSVAASSDFPFRGRTSGSYIVRPEDPATLIRYHRHSVTPGYFDNLGVPIVAGRTLTDGDAAGGPGVAVVTEALVRRVFPELPDAAAAVGRILYIGDPDDPENAAEIVGVVANVRYRNLTQDLMAGPNSPDVFFSIFQIPSGTLEISYRTDTPAAVLPAIREVVHQMDPATPIFLPQSLLEAYRAQTATPRFAALLMGIFSFLALVLASVGTYGVLAFSVNARAKEIAVRRALGSPAGTVARWVIWGGLRLALLGMTLGAIVSLLVAGVLESILFQVQAADPLTYLLVTLILGTVMVAAAAIPAWRATRKDPVEALSME